MKFKRKSRFMYAIEVIEKENKVRVLTLGDLVFLLGDMGHGVLILLLCLFFLQPIPLPGVSTPIGALVVILATLQFMHKAPWIPKRFLNHRLPQTAVYKIAEIARKIWAKLEKILKPRMLTLTRAPFWRLVNLAVIVLSSFLLALPLPIPFTNTIPAIVIISLCFAQLEDDGLAVLFAYVTSVGMVFFFGGLGIGLWNVLQRLWISFSAGLA
ncbi:MAG: exopolysaccharide biosynthesis protein [Bdellovibrionaceae bacterium]|nr:exopolysaccharide biosynthesis protein [Pseudobdellovibrionaceae bacterium]